MDKLRQLSLLFKVLDGSELAKSQVIRHIPNKDTRTEEFYFLRIRFVQKRVKKQLFHDFIQFLSFFLQKKLYKKVEKLFFFTRF